MNIHDHGKLLTYSTHMVPLTANHEDALFKHLKTPKLFFRSPWRIVNHACSYYYCLVC